MSFNRKWRIARKNMALALLGGKCSACGSTNGLEFDHIDPKSVRFRICDGNGIDRPLRVFLKEVDKCQLLCHDCHWAKTRTERIYKPYGRKIGHGSSMYTNYGCRCSECRKSWSTYKRKYRLKRKRLVGV